jgi:WD repeat-containing protein 61
MRLTTLHKTVAHEEGVWSTAWIPGGNRLLSGSVDESVKVWEDQPDGLRFVHTYHGHTLGVVSVAVDSTGEFAASSSLDSQIRVWSLHDHSTTALIEAATTETWSVAFMPRQPSDPLVLASAGGTRGAVLIWKMSRDDCAEVAAELFLPAVRHQEAFLLHSSIPLGPCAADCWPARWECVQPCTVVLLLMKVHG